MPAEQTRVPNAKRLLISLHDVSPRFEPQIDALLEILAGKGVPDRLAMLVIPDHWGSAPIVPGAPFAGKLRRWSDAGVEMFVHGWNHLDETVHQGRLATFKARHMTAREGEFLGLDWEESAARMAAGRALVEDITGRRAAGFIAPAWLYGPGAIEALGQSGFALAEDRMKVWRPDTGNVLCTGPVLTWASRSRVRIAASLLAARALARALRLVATVRVAVHPGDVGVPSLRRSIDNSLEELRRDRSFGRYADLLT